MIVEIDKEEDGRWIAEIPDLPGALTYGRTRDEAVAKVKALALRVLAALLRIGWSIKRQSGSSHRLLSRPGWPDFVSAFHHREEIGTDAGPNRQTNRPNSNAVHLGPY